MDLTSRTGEFKLAWDCVSLQDLLETSKAGYFSAQSDKVKADVGQSLWRNGVFDQVKFARYILGDRFDGTIEQDLAQPAAPPAQASGETPTTIEV